MGLKQFPSGITPPLVISYNASSVPILQFGLSGQGLSEQQLNDLGLNFIRPQLATIQGASVPIPHGGKVRQIMVDIDSQKLLSKGLSPLDVVNAVNTQNVVLPSGTAKIGRTEYNIGLNGNPPTVNEINDLPVRVIDGGTVYIRDAAHVRDGSGQTGLESDASVGIVASRAKESRPDTPKKGLGSHDRLARQLP